MLILSPSLPPTSGLSCVVQEDEDFGKTPGVCIVCWCPTGNIDASQVSASSSGSGSSAAAARRSTVRCSAVRPPCFGEKIVRGKRAQLGYRIVG